MSDRPSWSLLARLLRVARPYWAHILACTVLGLASVPLTLLAPVPMKIVVDHVLGARPLDGALAAVVPDRIASSPDALLVFAVALMVGTAVMLSLETMLSWLVQTWTTQRIVLEFRAGLFHHVQRLSLGYHDARGSSDASYRIQHDAPAIARIAVTGPLPLLTSGCRFLGMLWVTALMDWQLMLIGVSVAPVLYALTAVFGPRLRGEWRQVKRLESSAMSVVQEVLSALRVVKAFGREDHERERFVLRSGDSLRKNVDIAALQGRYDLLVGVTLAAGSAAGVYVGVLQVRSGVLSLGELLIVLSYLAMLHEPLRKLSKKTAEIQSAFASAERAFALLDEAPAVVERACACPLERAKGEIELRDVTFAYGPGREVLRGISFTARAGARVGIRGATGAGKTTLASLLMRFYDPQAGTILIDGVDIREYRLQDLRNQFAIVLQDPVLFSTTIAENIAYGRPGASRAEIEEAARQADAEPFILALPDGYDTVVGERGMRLSGGERQRLSLARAFLKDAPILVLDEPTSAVDAATEARIVRAIDRLVRGRTTFVIAHRLTTLASCDLHLRVEGGRLIDAGHEARRPAAEAG